MAFDGTRFKADPFKIGSQEHLELLFAKNQLLPRIREEFVLAGAPELLKDKAIPGDFGMDLLVQLVLHRRVHIAILTAILAKHFESHGTICNKQTAADLIVEAAEKGLCDILFYDVINPFTQEVTKECDVLMVYGISDDVQQELDQFQFPLPMIEEPLQLTKNNQTGYRTIRGSVILKNNHHMDDVCLDHINRMNRVTFRLNDDVVSFVQNKWKNLDKQKEDETLIEFRKRKEAFKKYDTVARDVIKAIQLHGDRFWLTHRYDKRGRVYSQGYHINYQGNDWNKACIEFAEGEPLNHE